MNPSNDENEPLPCVVYFDATVRRKERMRLASAQASPGNNSASRNIADSISTEDAGAHDGNGATETLASPQLTTSSNETPTPTPTLAESFSANPEVQSDFRSLPIQSDSHPDDNEGLTAEALSSFLINFVVEHTGYPPEVVELEADLEADLGIDSIKIAQMFGELRDRFGITATNDVSLDDFPTLQHVIDFLAPG